MNLDLRDSLVLKKTTEEPRHPCIWICAHVFCDYTVCFQLPLSSELTAHARVSVLHVRLVVYQVLVPQVVTLLPSPSASPHSVPSPNKWHQYSTQLLSVSINSPQTPFPLWPDCRLPCTVDQRVLLFLKYIFRFLFKNSLNRSLRTPKSTKLLVVEVIRGTFIYKAFLILNI